MIAMSRRRTMGNGNLAKGYKRLEWIASTDGGNQYINTGVVPEWGMPWRVSYQIVGNGGLLFGTSINNTDAEGAYSYSSQQNGRMTFVNDYGQLGAVSSDKSTTWVVSFDGASAITVWNIGLVIRTRYTDAKIEAATHLLEVLRENGRTLIMFAGRHPAWNTSNKVGWVSYFATSRIYRLTLGDVRDFIPCRDPNGVAGMYDTIGRQFYSSPNGALFVGSDEVDK